MKIVDYLKKAAEVILVTIPDKITEKIGIDKLAHIFLSLYIMWYFKIFGFGWGVVGLIFNTIISGLREFLSPNPDYSDTKVTFIACFLDLFIWGVLLTICELLGFQLYIF